MMNTIIENSMSSLKKKGNDCVFDKVIVSLHEKLEVDGWFPKFPKIESVLLENLTCLELTDSVSGRVFLVKWKDLLKDVEQRQKGIFSYLFGFHQEGLDYTDAVVREICNGNKLERYNVVYRMDICTCDPDAKGNSCIRASLYQVSMKE